MECHGRAEPTDLRRDPSVRTQDWKLFRRGTMVDDLAGFVPGAGDILWTRYVNRVNAWVVSGEEWSLVVNSVQSFDRTLLERAQRWVSETASMVCPGATQLTADLFVVIGQYRNGPTVIHKDSADTFLQVLDGAKEMLLWPYEALAHRVPDEAGDLRTAYHNLRLGPDDVTESPHVLRGGIDETMFWSHEYWHAARSDGHASFTLHLALHHADPVAQAPLRAAIRRTAGGFALVPAPRPATPWDPGRPLRLTHPGVVEVVPQEERPGSAFLVANGCVANVPDTPALARAVADLRRSLTEPLVLEDLDPPACSVLLRLASFLASVDALATERPTLIP